MADGAPGAWFDTTSLTELTEAQWENLCDRCGLCCEFRNVDPAGVVMRTGVSCFLLGAKNQCGDYQNRHARQPICIDLTMETLGDGAWLPPTCSYRLRAEGKRLPLWHPLRFEDQL